MLKRENQLKTNDFTNTFLINECEKTSKVNINKNKKESWRRCINICEKGRVHRPLGNMDKLPHQVRD